MGFFRKYILSLILYLLYPLFKPFIPNVKILNSTDSIKAVYTKNLSVIRFGDGEFNIMRGIAGPAFQAFSIELQRDLLSTFCFRSDKLLICIPETFSKKSSLMHNLTFNNKKFWKGYITKNIFFLRSILKTNYTYGDSLLTRPYISMRDRSRCLETFSLMKSIWDNKRIVIIEGNKTKFGVRNDLLDNTQEIKRIIAPSVNAYSKKNQILSFAKKIPKSYIFIIALGPSAKPIALNLFLSGYRVLDLGHLDIEYEWLIRNASNKIPIPNKYVNENTSRYFELTQTSNDTFKKQIIFDCS